MKLDSSEQVIHIHDSDVIKLNGYIFALCMMNQDVYLPKNHHVAEAFVLAASTHPVSIFPKIYSFAEKNYKSTNSITFETVKHGAFLLGNATSRMDCCYDDNKMFLKLYTLKQDYVIQLK